MKWFKMHTDTVLDNPRLGLLPLETQAVFFKLYALAARNGENGFIGMTLREIAWVLRLPDDALEGHLQALVEAGLVAWNEDGVQVLLYEEEQARIEREQAAERKRRSRSRHGGVTPASRPGHGDVTQESRSGHDGVTPIEEDTEEEKDTEREAAGVNTRAAASQPEDNFASRDEKGASPPQGPEAEVFRAWESDFGPLTPMLAESLQAEIAEHGSQWVLAAMREALANGKRNLRYVQAILRRWKAEGYGTDPPWRRENGSGPGPPQENIPEDDAALFLEGES